MRIQKTNNWVNMMNMSRDGGASAGLKIGVGKNESSSNSLLSERRQSQRKYNNSQLMRDGVSVESLFPLQNDTSVQQLEVILPQPADAGHLEKAIEPQIMKARHNQSTDAFNMGTRLPHLGSNLIKVHDEHAPLLQINTFGSKTSLVGNQSIALSTMATNKQNQIHGGPLKIPSSHLADELSAVKLDSQRMANNSTKFSHAGININDAAFKSESSIFAT